MPKAGKSGAMRQLQKELQVAVSAGKTTVAEIAEKTGLEQSLVYKYMRGDRPGTSLDTFLALLDAIGRHAGDFFAGTPQPKRDSAPERILSMHEEIGRYLKGKP